jgi:hypothetical protein
LNQSRLLSGENEAGMKAPVRSKSIGTKVTTEEYAVLEACAAEQKQSLSEWTRDALLAAAADDGTEKPAVPRRSAGLAHDSVESVLPDGRRAASGAGRDAAHH